MTDFNRPTYLSVHLPLMIIVIIFASCSDDDSGSHQLSRSDYIGQYTVDLTHITGIYPQYDDEGNPVGDGHDTIHYAGHMVNIVESDKGDSLNVIGLYNNYPERSNDIKAVLQDDTLQLSRNKDDIISKDNLQGHIYLTPDSIHISYRWDKTNIWASNALPHYGLVTGVGSRQ